MKPGSC